VKFGRREIDFVLAFLVLFDVTLTIWGFFLPVTWFRIFHGVLLIDPEGLLPRSAASWAAFALFQGIALFRWRKEPQWLAVVAGLRLGDIFTDLAYVGFATDITPFGHFSLIATGPINLLLGLFFLKSYKQQRKPC
jgi:hypothetical protein